MNQMTYFLGSFIGLTDLSKSVIAAEPILVLKGAIGWTLA
jgi:hypothetical protein